MDGRRKKEKERERGREVLDNFKYEGKVSQMSHKCHKTIKLLLRKFKLIPQITHMSYGIYSAPLLECNFKQCALCELGI